MTQQLQRRIYIIIQGYNYAKDWELLKVVYCIGYINVTL